VLDALLAPPAGRHVCALLCVAHVMCQCERVSVQCECVMFSGMPLEAPGDWKCRGLMLHTGSRPWLLIGANKLLSLFCFQLQASVTWVANAFSRGCQADL